ncbi:MAG: YciI family protein [Actinomycetes bacterium]|jgi:uncharacterized protein YciI
MEFDQFSLCFLVAKPNPPEMSPAVAGELQNAHMSHLADLHESGDLLAAGPTGNPAYRGVCLFRTEVEQTKELISADPAVQAGWFEITVIPWLVPSGAMSFSTTSFPRSMAEVKPRPGQ